MADEILTLEAKREKSKNYLLNIRNLPSIPVIMMEVSKLLDNPKTSATELGNLISKDQELVAKILAVANSPLYGLPRRVSTIEFAIVILGFDHIKNIVIALSMIEAFKNEDNKLWNKKAYWLHSLLTAAAAKRIADELGYRKSGEAFTAGLLHDLGISVIRRYFPKEFDLINETVAEQNVSFLDAEASIIGLSHCELGQILSDKWNLPQFLGDTILHHHDPIKSEENKILASIVHLADYMTQKLMIGNFDWDTNLQLDANVLETLHLGDEEYLEKFIQSYEPLFQNQVNTIII